MIPWKSAIIRFFESAGSSVFITAYEGAVIDSMMIPRM
jgi:hypothetical protein